MVAANGQKFKKAGGGTLVGVASFLLRPDWTQNLDALFRSRGENFDDYALFEGLPVARRVAASQFPDRRSQFVFNGFAAQMPNVGRGVLDGRLVLDNGKTQQTAPPEAVAIQTASLEGRVRARRRRTALFGPSFDARDDFERDYRSRLFECPRSRFGDEFYRCRTAFSRGGARRHHPF